MVNHKARVEAEYEAIEKMLSSLPLSALLPNINELELVGADAHLIFEKFRREVDKLKL